MNNGYEWFNNGLTMVNNAMIYDIPSGELIQLLKMANL